MRDELKLGKSIGKTGWDGMREVKCIELVICRS